MDTTLFEQVRVFDGRSDRLTGPVDVLVGGGVIQAVGTAPAPGEGEKRRVIEGRGSVLMPGLIDAHVHAIGAGLSEFKSKLPPLDSIADIQNYIREKAKTTPAGEWIIVPRTLPPRLKEQRFPTAADLDAKVADMCKRLLSHAPITMRCAKEAVRRIRTANIPDGSDLIRAAYGSADFKEGVSAFLAKRPPDWQGR